MLSKSCLALLLILSVTNADGPKNSILYGQPGWFSICHSFYSVFRLRANLSQCSLLSFPLLLSGIRNAETINTLVKHFIYKFVELFFAGLC